MEYFQGGKAMNKTVKKLLKCGALLGTGYVIGGISETLYILSYPLLNDHLPVVEDNTVTWEHDMPINDGFCFTGTIAVPLNGRDPEEMKDAGVFAGHLCRGHFRKAFKMLKKE